MARIYITGASCAGVTTLWRGLAAALGTVHADCDDFYWMPTDPPFTTKRPAVERVSLIRTALGEDGWVLSGSFDGWGDPLIASVDLVVFVRTSTPIRMERLRERERRLFGPRILPGGDMHAIHTAFAEWASHYDDPAFSGRNIGRHDVWLAAQSAPVLRLDGARPRETLVAEVLAEAACLRGIDAAS
ncbi:adenylate kinase [Aureimonas leprariae]|uniref:Adenylate kinase n=1 Tax=Plantimonas leprariae TaxID=2615207 RepID=A0A7V7PLK2_9HYPH|nr:adenylate kinase [Aureimonas leprariae]KAB0677361.1 adenylate kinase [Aureimonas leprariae]